MAEWGSGSFTPGVYNKEVPGAYINVSVSPNEAYELSQRGYVAAMVDLPGGEDNAIITITQEEFDKNSEKYFGVPKTDESLLPVRELLKQAHTAYLYRLNSGGQKAKGVAGTARYSGEVGNNITVTVLRNADLEDTYDVMTYYNGELKETQNVSEATVKTISLVKGQETKGTDVKPTFINKWGFVKDKYELANITKPTTPADLTKMSEDVFYFQFKDIPENGVNYAAIFEVDGKKYAQPLWNSKKDKNYYLSFKDNSDGTFVYDEDWKANTGYAPIDVDGKTVKVSLYDYGKKVDLAALKGEPTEKIIDEVEIDCTDSVAKGEAGSGKAATANIAFAENTITVEFSDVPEGYETSVKVKNGDNYVPFKTNEVEQTVKGSKYTITYGWKSNTDGDMTVEAILTNYGSTVIKSCAYTCKVTDGNAGADASELNDNDYVIFNKNAVLLETGGDVFKGGSLGKATGESYVEAKDLFEAFHFNTLAVATTDLTTQDMFIDYVKSQRDVEGVKFQIVIPHAPKRREAINYEGVIEYSPINTVANDKYKDTGLTYWLAGAEAGCPVESNLTGTEYDGELEVEARVTRAQQKSTIRAGQVLFNKMGDSVILLRDINTLTSVPSDSTTKNMDFAKNQTIRVLDGLVQETANCFNNFFVRGHLNNNEINRAELKNQLIKIRQQLATIGAINGYDESLMTIEPGERLGDVIGSDGVSIAGAMEFLYFTINLVSETA